MLLNREMLHEISDSVDLSNRYIIESSGLLLNYVLRSSYLFITS